MFASGRRASRLTILSGGEVEQIHEQSLDVLEKTGIEMGHPAGQALLEAAGAGVDRDASRVRIPRTLVEQCLSTLPDRCLLAARDPAKDCMLEPGCRPYSRNGGGGDYTLDLESGDLRPLLEADMVEYFRLADALPNIDFVAPVFGHDLPEAGRDILVLRQLFANTDKHVHMRVYSKRSLEYVIEMAQIVGGGKQALLERPLVSLLEAPISPLKFIDIIVDALILCGEVGMPLELCLMPIAGATGPMTLAGNTLLFNVEFLACVVISQLANPGAPLEYAPRPMIMDMRTGMGLTGSMEGALMSVAGAQMARYYNVPLSLHGPWTDAVAPDAQSSLESVYYTMLPALAGAQVLAGAGMLQQGLSFSHAKLVMDDEIHGLTLEALEGFAVDEAHLAAEALDRVGPGGNFLADAHTLEFLRSGERYSPNLLFRQTRELWEAQGSTRFEEHAQEKAIELLRTHEPNPLPEDVSRALDEVVAHALPRLQEA